MFDERNKSKKITQFLIFSNKGKQASRQATVGEVPFPFPLTFHSFVKEPRKKRKKN